MHLCHLASSLVTKSERHTALLSEFMTDLFYLDRFVSQKRNYANSSDRIAAKIR